MRALYAILLLSVWPALHAQTLALTFDDGLDPGKEKQAQRWNDELLGGLKSAGITAMFFPAVSKVGAQEGQALVEAWAAAGHAVGNHTSRHRNLNSKRLALQEFLDDVKAADAQYRGLRTWAPMLRFPYLKEGDTAEKRDGVRAWLRANGYKAAPVSIDTSDWYYDNVWRELKSRGDEARAVRLQQAYVEHLLDRARYYDRLARRTLGRSPQHVMLLHVNALNASSIETLVKAFRSRGWSFVSPAAAFADSMYAEQPDVLPAGESIVWALAKASGVKELRYPAEDGVYEEPALQAQGLLP